MDSDEIAHSRELITIQKRRLHELEKQAAMLGVNCPPHISIEIEDIKQNIEVFVRKIAGQPAEAYPATKEVMRQFNQEIDAIAIHLQEIILEEKRTYRIFGIPVFTVSVIVSRTVNILLFIIGIGLSRSAYNHMTQSPPITDDSPIVATPVKVPSPEPPSKVIPSAVVVTATVPTLTAQAPTANPSTAQAIAATQAALATANAEAVAQAALATANAEAATQQAIAQQTAATRPTPRPTRTPAPPTPAPESTAECRVQGRGSLFVGSCSPGSRLSGQKGSCITGRVLARDGTPFQTVLLSVDIGGSTIRVPLDAGGYDPSSGNYSVCGLRGGEWGVTVINVNRGKGIEGNPDQTGSQVIVRLSGADGEHAVVSFRE